MENSYNYDDIIDSPIFESFHEMERVMQKVLPAIPRPQKIKHVVLDADDTMWYIKPYNIASAVEPIGTTKKNTLPVTMTHYRMPKDIPPWLMPLEGKKATALAQLDPTLRFLLKTLKEKGIPVSVASCNTKESIIGLLNAFGITDYFTDIEADMERDKNKMVRDIAKRHGLDTEEMLFVDDSFQNAMDVAHCTDALSLIMGHSIGKIVEIMDYIE